MGWCSVVGLLLTFCRFFFISSFATSSYFPSLQLALLSSLEPSPLPQDNKFVDSHSYYLALCITHFQTVQVQKPWYESVTDFTDTVSNGGAVSDIFERNAQKRKEGRQNPYSGMGGTWVSGARSTGPPPNAAGGAKAERNGNAHNDGKARTSSSSSAKSAKGRSTNNAGTTSRPNSTSKNNNSNPFGGFTSSAANTMSDIFDRNARKRDEHRRAGTGPYDPNQSVLEEKLASLMKQAAEADERYNNLKREMMNGDSSLKEQNVALRRDAAGYKARCQSLEEELKTAQVKAAAAAKASTAAAATKKNNGSLSSKEKAVLGEKIAALRKEASDAKAKCSAMEEQVAVAQVRCESLEAALKTAKAELDDKKKGGRWGFGSGGDTKDADEENEALQAKVDELETSVRNHVDVVQKYKKECDTLKQKAEKNISGTNGNDHSADKAGPKRERSSLRQAFRMRVSQTAAKSTEFIKEPSLKILNKLNRSRKNGRKDATTPIDSTSDAPTLDSPSPRATIATHGKRIPTGARAKARMMPNHKYTTKKSSEFASAVGIASSSAKESVKGEASVASLSSERSLSSVDTLRRVSDRMHEKKALIISGSVALLVVRSLLKAWIKGGLL